MMDQSLVSRWLQVVLVRDLDSRLSAREAAAVADWLNDTQFAVHVMRSIVYLLVTVLPVGVLKYARFLSTSWGQLTIPWSRIQIIVFLCRDHPSHSWPMLGGMWGARFDWEHKEEGSTLPLQDPATGEGQVPSARSLLAGLVTNMLHSPISWASVYLADQAYHLCVCDNWFCLLKIFFNRRQPGATTTGVLASCAGLCFGNNIRCNTRTLAWSAMSVSWCLSSFVQFSEWYG